MFKPKVLDVSIDTFPNSKTAPVIVSRLTPLVIFTHLFDT